MTTLHDKVPAGLDRKETEMYRRLDPRRLPKHIAIIMDGNGRWAKRRHMPRVAGHRAGVEAVRSIFPLMSFGQLEFREMQVDVHPHAYLGKVQGCSSWLSTGSTGFSSAAGIVPTYVLDSK